MTEPNRRDAHETPLPTRGADRAAGCVLLFGSAAEPVLVADPTTRQILYANAAAGELYGCSASELRGLNLLLDRSVSSVDDWHTRFIV